MSGPTPDPTCPEEKDPMSTDTKTCAECDTPFTGKARQRFCSLACGATNSNRKRSRATHCSEGHEFNEANTYTDKLGKRHCRLCRRVRPDTRSADPVRPEDKPPATVAYWHASAPCAQVGGDLWFPGDGEVPHEARRICATCPYKAPCLLEAIEREETAGVWGGVTTRQFPKIRAELGMAAPRTRGDDTTCKWRHDRSETRLTPGGKRVCRACSAENSRRARQRKRAAA